MLGTSYLETNTAKVRVVFVGLCLFLGACVTNGGTVSPATSSQSVNPARAGLPFCHKDTAELYLARMFGANTRLKWLYPRSLADEVPVGTILRVKDASTDSLSRVNVFKSADFPTQPESECRFPDGVFPVHFHKNVAHAIDTAGGNKAKADQVLVEDLRPGHRKLLAFQRTLGFVQTDATLNYLSVDSIVELARKVASSGKYDRSSEYYAVVGTVVAEHNAAYFIDARENKRLSTYGPGPVSLSNVGKVEWDGKKITIATKPPRQIGVLVLSLYEYGLVGVDPWGDDNDLPLAFDTALRIAERE